MKSTPNLLKHVAIAWVLLLIASAIVYNVSTVLLLFTLSIVSFIQNMFFTWVSRSRQSGDPDYHRFAAWGSNGVWILTQTFIAANVYTPITTMIQADSFSMYEIGKIIFTFFIYALATTEGSVFMMKALLGKLKIPIIGKYLVEKGKRQVGER